METRYHAMVQQDGQLLLEHYLMSGGNYQFCWHKPLEFMLVLKGTAEVFADGRCYLLEQDDMLLINSNCGHSMFLRDLESLVLICEVAPSFFQRQFSMEVSTLQIECASSPASRREPMFAQLRFLLARSFVYAFEEDPLAHNLSIHYMTALLGELMLHFPTHITEQKQGKGKEKETLQRVMSYIETNFDQKLTLEEVSSHVQYNRTYLSTLFKKSTGILFNDYIIRVRLRHALEALGDEDRSIVSIALDHGFPDSKSFSASMKKYCGRTPQEYRQALRQNSALRIPQGADKYLPKPDAEAEKLLVRCGMGLEGTVQPQPAEEGNRALLREYCDQLEEIVDRLRGFL
ncbi:AraC family transcriptional regulator [uncultured Dysosmobacter sp.]|uniref:AraC family transcriptional regulator n=1 Tax=uncultured Dysosmobacter sp. TaxID=2591384 RepID=UPI00260BCC64|nr:AraC family transcriptional regulator [uncultured Dysosmobacter sp.]